MLSFLKYTLATIIGTLLTFLLFIFILIGIISVSTQKEPIQVKENSILKLDLDKFITERQPIDPLSEFNMSDDAAIQGLNTLKKTLKAAQEDPKINGIFIDAGIFMDAGLATLEEIRNELLDFKKSNKFIIAYGENYSQKAYYLASAADKIYLNPMGIIDLKGINGQVTFFKNALEKLDVEVQVIRGPDNKFKSAVEPFIYDKMSESNKEQTSVFLGSIWNSILTKIGAERKLSTDELQLAANNLLGYDPNTALKSGLIDGIKYWDEIVDELKKLNKTHKNNELEFITIGKYAKTVGPKINKTKQKIALIYANGEIRSGEGDDDIIGSDRIAKAIRDARADSTIKAIVFRINSPGGSAQASEVIHRELELTKGIKPIVVSMGDYAASGGYYIACNADKIYAQPSTLTGSIGVFGMIPNLQKLVNNKLGITFDGVKTADNADIYSLTQPLTPYQSEIIHSMINSIYSTFLNHVAEGRKMTVKEVDNIGQGRVWSGVDALKLGLVDEIGGIDDAIAYAVKLANLTEYKVLELPKQKNPFEELIKQLNGEIKVDQLISNKLGFYGEYYNFITTLNQKDQIQARLPFIISIN